jgi:hypothetical protein
LVIMPLVLLILPVSVILPVALSLIVPLLVKVPLLSRVLSLWLLMTPVGPLTSLSLEYLS